MKIKRIISSLVAFAITTSIGCISAHAYDESNISEQCGFEYTDKTLYLDNGITALNENNFGYIQSKSNPLVSVNASVNNTDNVLNNYNVKACVRDYYDYEIVDELVVLLGGLSYGDRLTIMILDSNEEIVVFDIIEGKNNSGAIYYFPVDSVGEYKIYVTLASTIDEVTGDNDDVSYILQVASRYVHGTKKCYASPSTLRNQGRYNFSSSASAVIKETDVPSSAIIDNIYTYGTLTNDKTGIIGICTMKIVNGSNELYSDGPTGYLKNLTSRNIPLAGTWYISYRPEWDNSSTLSNLSISFDYTYDILN